MTTRDPNDAIIIQARQFALELGAIRDALFLGEGEMILEAIGELRRELNEQIDRAHRLEKERDQAFASVSEARPTKTKTYDIPEEFRGQGFVLHGPSESGLAELKIRADKRIHGLEVRASRADAAEARVEELEVELETESQRRQKAIANRDRANEVCDRALARVAELQRDRDEAGAFAVVLQERVVGLQSRLSKHECLGHGQSPQYGTCTECDRHNQEVKS